MIQQIRRISIHQTAKILGLVYGAFGLLFMPILLLGTLNDPIGLMPMWMVLGFPVLYAAIGYVFTAIGAAIYNGIAKTVGGIELTLAATTAPEL